MESRKTDGRRERRRRLLTAVVLLLAVTLWSGCNGVRRRLAITSNPPGATVFLNDREIGQTPISQNIVYSGTYKIRLEKEGMETKTLMHDVRTPWYLWPGVDFVSENLVPGELRDNQSCHVELSGKRVIPDNELFDNAVSMRTEAHDQSNLRHYQGNASGLVPQTARVPSSPTPIVNPPSTGLERTPSTELAARTDSFAAPAGGSVESLNAESVKNAGYLFTAPALDDTPGAPTAPNAPTAPTAPRE